MGSQHQLENEKEVPPNLACNQFQDLPTKWTNCSISTLVWVINTKTKLKYISKINILTSNNKKS